LFNAQVHIHSPVGLRSGTKTTIQVLSHEEAHRPFQYPGFLLV
jgi:hypothetical protein